jgi:hypothetical protein
MQEPQIIVQFDTLLSILAEEAPVLATCDMLSRFCSALGLLSNEAKSSAYYWHLSGRARHSLDLLLPVAVDRTWRCFQTLGSPIWFNPLYIGCQPILAGQT